MGSVTQTQSGGDRQGDPDGEWCDAVDVHEAILPWAAPDVKVCRAILLPLYSAVVHGVPEVVGGRPVC